MMKKMFSLFFCLNYDLKDNDENVLFYFKINPRPKAAFVIFCTCRKIV